MASYHAEGHYVDIAGESKTTSTVSMLKKVAVTGVAAVACFALYHAFDNKENVQPLFVPSFKQGTQPAVFSTTYGKEKASTAAVTWLNAEKSAPTDEPNSNFQQGFLEYTPYHDFSELQVNIAKPKTPFTGKVVSVERIVGPEATGETCHIVIKHDGGLPFVEGQSYGIIPPGINPKNDKPYPQRLYSIASTRYGDDMTGNTGSLCVRRAVYWDPELGAEDPEKKGVCSNYLCDLQPGEDVKMTGPVGKMMLMPEAEPWRDLIMVGTGTGIAPYRGFVRRLFVEDTPARKAYTGLAWLFLGVANTDALLYDDEFQAVRDANPEQFRIDYALSREQKNKDGGKMYIQDKVGEYADEIFTRLDNGAVIYFCGLKGMMPGIEEMLKKVCESKGIEYDTWYKALKKAGQWHVEVY